MVFTPAARRRVDIPTVDPRTTSAKYIFNIFKKCVFEHGTNESAL